MQAWQGSALHTHYVEGLTCVRLTGGAAGFVCGAGGLRSSIERMSAGGRQRRKDGSILKWHWRQDSEKITERLYLGLNMNIDNFGSLSYLQIHQVLVSK